MKIRTLTLGDYQTNCYLVSDEKGVTAVIDPGYEPEKIAAVLRENGLTLGAVLLTHCHFDHVGGVKTLVKSGCPVYINEKDLTLPPFMTAGEVYYTDGYEETVTVGELTFTVMETPGHTPGSVCLQCGDVLFSGDTLFAGSCGRMDFPGGSSRQMGESLHSLRLIPEDLRVCPGHGEETTLDRERRQNPYMR